MDAAAPSVLVVGHPENLNPTIESRLRMSDLQPVWQTPDPEVAFEMAARHRPRFIVFDFDLPLADAEVIADAFRELTPAVWVMDFRGVLRRRPDDAPVSLEHTEPLLVTIH